MTRLLLIRHAPTVQTGSKLTGRLPGFSLSDEGQAMARSLGEQLAGAKLRRIYTSPIERTRETAEAIAGHHRLTPIVHEGLSEVDYGRWAGRSFKTLRRNKLWSQLFIAPSRVRFPGGESLAEMQARAVQTCEEMAAAAPAATIVAVTHADVIKAILAHYLGLHLDLYQRLVVAPASISVVELGPRGFPIVPVINHLARPDRFDTPATPGREQPADGSKRPTAGSGERRVSGAAPARRG